MNIFKVNQKLEVQPLSSSLRTKRKPVYATYITELGRDTLSIAAPIFRGRFVTFPRGQRLKAFLPGPTALYTFTTSVVGDLNYPTPQLIIKYPTEIARCQRRRFVRIEVLIPASVELPDAPDNSLLGNVVDLSAGGAKLVMNKSCSPGTVVKLTLLQEPYLETEAQVLRVEPVAGQRSRWEWAVEFIGLTEQERDNIIKFIFAMQREMRRKGLL
ncbi:MAG: flagellar brake protein [bacterium]